MEKSSLVCCASTCSAGPFFHIHFNDIFEAESADTGQAFAFASPEQILIVVGTKQSLIKLTICLTQKIFNNAQLKNILTSWIVLQSKYTIAWKTKANVKRD